MLPFIFSIYLYCKSGFSLEPIFPIYNCNQLLGKNPPALRKYDVYTTASGKSQTYKYNYIESLNGNVVMRYIDRTLSQVECVWA